MKKQVNPVIEEFIEQYKKEQDAYRRLCDITKKRLKNLLEQKGIMAIVSARVKDPERLRGKLIKRDGERTAAGLAPFRDAGEIFDDTHDLVGARVALYFPSDADHVGELLSPQFTVVERKVYPPKAEHYGEMVLSGYTAHKRRIYQGYDDRRFDGYCAIHHHVRFPDTPVPELPDIKVEIQVASVMMHAWSEVEHDLAYKKLMGAVSPEEYACLDELNGLVMAGELVLNRLNQLSQQRIQGISHFESHYALAAYLSHWQKQQSRNDRPLGNVEILFESYRKKDVLTAGYLDKQLQKLEKQHWAEDEKPLADQLLELFNADNRSIVADLVSKAVLDVNQERTQAPTETQIRKFQQRWNVLEDLSKKSLRKLGHSTSNRTSKLLSIEMEYALSKEFADDYNRLRCIRNQVVYGHLAPSRAEMDALIADIDRLGKFLQDEYGVKA